MERDTSNNDLIDLGVASAETKGGPHGVEDRFTGLIPVEGLNDE